MKKIFILIFIIFTLMGYSQTCENAQPFCTDTEYNFPLATNTTSEIGPYYDCLLTQPNPVWYYLLIDESGDIDISMNAGADIDFCCWGPFPTLENSCDNLTASNVVDCSYSIAAIEECNITNANVGEYYILVITNFANVQQDIEFSQTGGDGSTDCSIICQVDAGLDNTICINDTIQLGGDPVLVSGIEPVIYEWSNLSNDSTPVVQPIITTNYYVTMTTADNCVAIDSITITVLEQTELNLYDTICYNSYYLFNNDTLYTSGLYHDTLQNVNGCDSIINFNLTVLELEEPILNYENETCDNLCDGNISIQTTYNVEINDSIINNITNLCPSNYNIKIYNDFGCYMLDTITIEAAPELKIDTILFTKPLCYGDDNGSISIQTTSCEPTTYELNDIINTNGVFNNLISDEYIIKIIDCNNCEINDTLYLQEPEQLEISDTLIDISCHDMNNGSIKVDVDGGTGLIRYYLNNDEYYSNEFNNLSGGEYIIKIVDENNCYLEKEYYINNPDDIIINITSSKTICKNDTTMISVSVIGGQYPYNFNWVNNNYNTQTIYVAPEQSTTYICQVVDSNNCLSNIVSTTLDLYPDLEINTNVDSVSVCPGENVDITILANGGKPPYSVFLDNEMINNNYSYIPIISEDLTFRVTDLCNYNDTKDVHVNVYDIPNFDFYSDYITDCQPFEVRFNSDISLYNDLKWEFGDGNISTSYTPINIYENHGFYDVRLTLTTKDGCVTSKIKNNYIQVLRKPIARFNESTQLLTNFHRYVYFDNNSLYANNYRELYTCST